MTAPLDLAYAVDAIRRMIDLLSEFEYHALATGDPERISMSRMSFQVAAIIIFAATLFFIWDFSQRIVTNARIAQNEKQLEVQVARAEATHSALLARRQYVQSDAFIEDKVRTDWRWARENDTVVVTQKTPAPTPPPSAPQPTPLPLKPWWQDVLDFLFGP